MGVNGVATKLQKCHRMFQMSISYRVCPPERSDKFIFDTVEYPTHPKIRFYKQTNRDFVLFLVYWGILNVFHNCPKCLLHFLYALHCWPTVISSSTLRLL